MPDTTDEILALRAEAARLRKSLAVDARAYARAFGFNLIGLTAGVGSPAREDAFRFVEALHLRSWTPDTARLAEAAARSLARASRRWDVTLDQAARIAEHSGRIAQLLERHDVATQLRRQADKAARARRRAA